MAEGEGDTLMSQNNTDGNEGDNAEASNTDGQVAVVEEVNDNVDPIDPPVKEGEVEKDIENKTEVDKPVVPEKYETFKIAEGMSLNQESLKSFSPLAKELGLTQENAQKVVDMGAKLVQDAANQQKSTLEAMKAEWAESTKKDSELGGDKLQANIETAVKARNTFGSEGLNKILDESGLGNHPEVIRFFRNVGKAISEDSLVTDKSNPAKETSEAELLYPGMGFKDG